MKIPFPSLNQPRHAHFSIFHLLIYLFIYLDNVIMFFFIFFFYSLVTVLQRIYLGWRWNSSQGLNFIFLLHLLIKVVSRVRHMSISDTNTCAYIQLIHFFKLLSVLTCRCVFDVCDVCASSLHSLVSICFIIFIA
jgi:energy-coupling factor transporter transmembrane protein EcfT